MANLPERESEQHLRPGGAVGWAFCRSNGAICSHP
jgi:hypothetical protein